ncbi:hypothetical protein GGX14DRAFT_650327 [Mycena pura]|uniref:Uncharacterized protein n=1 Tax=Mycena pura TaxID=153505 RepID=A0AAD6YNK8_9AGAR|nr:hypothetical protein GGX14DRAFT_650327 [Mycena pura]
MTYRRSIWTPRCFIPFLFAFYILLSTPEQIPTPDLITTDPANSNWPNLALQLEETPSIERGSLTAILPVTRTSVLSLRDTLSPFLGPATCVSKVLVVCPESLLAQSRAAIHQAVHSVFESDNHPEVSLYPWAGDNPSAVVLKAASLAPTKWVLLLDETGLNGLSNRTGEMLLCPTAARVPIGPRGVIGSPNNRSCAPPSPKALPAAYLLPPFALPSSTVHESYESWSDLGRAISQSLGDELGGVIRSFGDPDSNWCKDVHVQPHNFPIFANQQDAPELSMPSTAASLMTNHHPGFFIFLLPNVDVLDLAQRLICLLHEAGHEIKILLYSDARPAAAIWGKSSRCRLHYETAGQKVEERHVYPMIRDWLEQLEYGPDVILTLHEMIMQTLWIENVTLVRIPREDLMHAHWMGSLSLSEWRNWNIPRIEISVITQDRPQSLERLLSSLARGRFFGDPVALRMNMEQSSDLETIRIVGAYKWNHGNLFIHRRVVHGGLIPAVVESWYPSSNDSYGLLLEDDVELSPLFYAWIKMGILRYRYGEAKDRTGHLFGISLYQQKNIELHPEGRKAFNPRSLFTNSRLPHPSTPYLSQIPCSWGAVYFPEHWREFHDYLATRLSESMMEIDRIVVPNVRSNNWTKSWKKYFIELVYLRGYVMLYPNYEGFMSLSTNHLEVGSHVKDRPKEKQDMFRLPLMELRESWRLLEVPGGALPPWETLPVVNLTGFMSSLEIISSLK